MAGWRASRPSAVPRRLVRPAASSRLSPALCAAAAPGLEPCASGTSRVGPRRRGPPLPGWAPPGAPPGWEPCASGASRVGARPWVKTACCSHRGRGAGGGGAGHARGRRGGPRRDLLAPAGQGTGSPRMPQREATPAAAGPLPEHPAAHHGRELRQGALELGAPRRVPPVLLQHAERRFGRHPLPAPACPGAASARARALHRAPRISGRPETPRSPPPRCRCSREGQAGRRPLLRGVEAHRPAVHAVGHRLRRHRLRRALPVEGHLRGRGHERHPARRLPRRGPEIGRQGRPAQRGACGSGTGGAGGVPATARRRAMSSLLLAS